MLDVISKRIAKAANVRNIVICALVFLLLLTLINGKPFGVAQLKGYTNGVGILDLEGHYTPQEAYQILELQGEQGRSFYKQLLIRLDIIFPLSYSLLWMLIISIIYNKVFNSESKWQRFCLLPAFAGLSDWLENLFILIVLGRYPKPEISLITLANAMTITKGLLIEISMVLIAGGLARMLYRRLRKK